MPEAFISLFKGGETPFSIAVSEGQQDIVEMLVDEFFSDVERWLVVKRNLKQNYDLYISFACSIDSLLNRFFNKVEAVCCFIERTESEVLADVEVSYIQLVQQMK